MSRQPGRHKTLRRQRPRQDQRTRFVVFCEGKITEPKYLKAFAALPRVRSVATLEIRGLGFDPRRLVEDCKQQKREEEKPGNGPTHYWGVFDVEAPQPHARLREAMQIAHDSGIQVAISNPCFEVWLLLHHTDHRRWVTNNECHRFLREHDRSGGKSVDGNLYMPLVPAATERAKQLEAMHERAGARAPDNNPSTGINHLLQAIDPTLAADS